jgi:hypothetical protein
MIVRCRGASLLGIVLVIAVSCDTPAPTGFSGDEGVAARGSGGIARITNGRARPIYYFLAERQDSIVIDWSPCREDLETCPHVDPDQTLALPYRAITGFDTGDEQAILYWWHLAAGPRGGLVVDRVRSVVFSL